jgi:hypothetical protein
MTPEMMRVLLAEAMHWTLEYTDGLELRDRLEVFAVLSGRNEAQHHQPKAND